MSLSEAQTRKEIIDHRLLKAGWNINDPSHVTEELDIISDPMIAKDPGEKYSGHLFSDYALLGKDGYPLAVVEAKKTSRSAEEGKLQALLYAETMLKNNPGKDLPFVLYLKPNHNLINVNFLHAMRTSTFVTRQVNKLVRGVAQKTLNLRELKSILIISPAIHIQEEFGMIVKNFEEQKQLTIRSLQKSEDLFQSFLQRAFREFRISD